MGRGTTRGTVLQVAMVVVGHYLPLEQQAWWFPVVGTALGGVTGWLAGGGPGATGAKAGSGAVAGGLAGVLGSLVSTALGDAPLGNVAIAGGSTLVSGAIGAVLRGFLAKK